MQLGTDAYYMTKVPQAFLYEKDGTVADEVLSGWILQRLGQQERRQWLSQSVLPTCSLSRAFRDRSSQPFPSVPSCS